MAVIKRVLCRERSRQVAPGPSKLDPFNGQIVRWLQSHPCTAAQIFLRLRHSGYGGGVTVIKDYVHQVRPPPTTPFLTLSFAAGRRAGEAVAKVR
jgi:hypothetical protein